MKGQAQFPLAGSAESGTSLSTHEKIARLRLIRTETVGPTTFKALIARFGSADEAISNIPDLARRGGRKKALKIPPKAQAERELAAIDAYGARALILGDRAYPSLLAHIEDAPPVLIAKGASHLVDRPTIGIVGARNASTIGRKQAHQIAAELSQAGVTIISGLARGIDTAAHNGALSGGTVAVVAGGLDVFYPRENEALQRAIAEQGLLVSDEPLGVQPQARHFPKRNRIISGLSMGILVVEAAQRSGSLITARLAAEQGREVFAIPGSPLDPRAKGANHLIKSGATLIESSQDILENLQSMRPPLSEPDQRSYSTLHTVSTQDISMDTRTFLRSRLSPTPTRIDDLVYDTDLDIGVVLTILLELELAGSVERLPGGRVCLINGPIDTSD